MSQTGNMMSVIIRLFYSVKCDECMNLWQVIYNEGIGRVFIPVCLDKYTSKQIQNLGIGIKELPSIVVSTQNHPPMIHEGPQQCSQWLTNFTLNRRKVLAQQLEQQRKIIQKEHARVRALEDGPIEYLECEMDGISDAYAYNDTDLCQPKNFVMVGNEENSRIVTVTNTKDCKFDMAATKAYVAELEKSRGSDNINLMQDMEKRQINTIINRSYGE
jgi:hypothetical protein